MISKTTSVWDMRKQISYNINFPKESLFVTHTLLPCLPAKACTLRVLLSECFPVKIHVYDVFSKIKMVIGCFFIKINSLVFELRIHSCLRMINAIMLISNRNVGNTQDLYQTYLLTISHHYCGCRTAVVWTLFQNIRSISYGCRKTSVRNREAVRRPYHRRLVSRYVTILLRNSHDFWTARQPQRKLTTISHIDTLGRPVNKVLMQLHKIAS